MKNSWLLAGVAGFVLAMFIAVGIAGGVYVYGLIRRNTAPAAGAPVPRPALVPVPAPANPGPAAPPVSQPNIPIPPVGANPGGQQPPQDAPLAPLPGGGPGPQVPPAGQPAVPGIAPAPQPAQPQPAGPQPLPLPQPPAGQGQEPDVAMARYRHPSGTFGIEYPQGWRVRAQSGGTTFYKDDPDEGTSFTVVAMQPAQGELKTRQVLQAVIAAARKQYPDLRVKPGTPRNLGSPGAIAEMLEADAWWTNARGKKMQAAVLIITTTSPGAGFTSFTFLSGQAPLADFPAMRPTYQRMMQSMGPGT